MTDAQPDTSLSEAAVDSAVSASTRVSPVSSRRRAVERPSRAATPNLDAPELYINRELSFLQFNQRVLAQALDLDTPLLERLRFVTITSTNLDEFFEVRVAGLKQRIAFNLAEPGADGLTAAELLRGISEMAGDLVREQYRILNEVILPALADEGVRILKRSVWSEAQQGWIHRYFNEQVLPVLSPVGLDPSHPFPRMVNKGLSFIVVLEGEDAFGRTGGMAVVHVPRCLPRVIPLPEEDASGHDFVLLSSVIHAHIGEIFRGMRVTGCYQFRVTRNSNLWVDEEEVEDLLKALQGELPARNYGAAVRLEVADNCTKAVRTFLQARFDLDEADVFQVDGPVNLHRLVAIYNRVARPDLKYPRLIAGVPPRVEQAPDVFTLIRDGDVLLHHPYETFQPVIELVRQAARDPDVLAIKQTVYRTGKDSPLAEALVEAARAGKEVMAIIELRARFDEAANIDLATRLQEAGANVCYGIVGYKAHAKMLMVVRREGDKLRRYVHLGTGNYHAGTALAYEDFGFLTCDKHIGNDVHKLFMQMTGFSQVMKMKRLMPSPFLLRQRLIQRIEGEAAQAQKGKPARIIAKMNALSEPAVIRALYRAAQAGVRIDLIVRGICCLRPGIEGVSETIRVRSVVGRFLEHSRVYYFHAGGKEEVYCASADWMPRNLRRRVEICFPIRDPEVKARVIEEGLNVYLDDNTQAWEMRADGSYERRHPAPGEEPRAAQEALLAKLAGP